MRERMLASHESIAVVRRSLRFLFLALEGVVEWGEPTRNSTLPTPQLQRSLNNSFLCKIGRTWVICIQLFIIASIRNAGEGRGSRSRSWRIKRGHCTIAHHAGEKASAGSLILAFFLTARLKRRMDSFGLVVIPCIVITTERTDHKPAPNTTASGTIEFINQPTHLYTTSDSQALWDRLSVGVICCAGATRESGGLWWSGFTPLPSESIPPAQQLSHSVCKICTTRFICIELQRIIAFVYSVVLVPPTIEYKTGNAGLQRPWDYDNSQLNYIYIYGTHYLRLL